MTALATRPVGQDIEQLLIQGDLSRLNSDQRVAYYKALCESVGLNPLTQPFSYINLSGKLVLYARKDCTDQLRKLHGVSVEEMRTETLAETYLVTVRVKDKAGRSDIATGAVALKGLGGEYLANALMKAETKAKRRATLSICGLGMLDETEAEDVPGAYTPPPAGDPKKPPPPPPPPPATETVETVPPPDPKLMEALDEERAATIDRVRSMMLKQAPEGMGWHPKHASAWLVKYFGVKKPIDLSRGQAEDAGYLLLARLQKPEEYAKLLEQFAREKRVLTAELTAEI